MLRAAGVVNAAAPMYVTYYGNAFDLPLLWRKAIRHSVPALAKILPHRKFDRSSIDLHELFLATDYRGKTGGLNNILNFFGLPQKLGDGSQIFDWFHNGEFDKIKEYAQADVAAIQKLYFMIEDCI